MAEKASQRHPSQATERTKRTGRARSTTEHPTSERASGDDHEARPFSPRALPGSALLNSNALPSSGTDELREEFERLAQRPMHAFESRALTRVIAGESAWLSGLTAESGALIALTARTQADGPVLFFSPESELLRDRGVRFGSRAPTLLVAPEDGDIEDERSALERVLHGSRDGLSSGSPSEGPPVIWCSLEAANEPDLQRLLVALRPTLVFVESAHSASPLAHEIRPAFQKLALFLSLLPEAAVYPMSLACPLRVREDALARLGLCGARGPQAPSEGGFDHVDSAPIPANVVLQVRHRAEPGEVTELLAELPRPAIVFCSTPADVDRVFGILTEAQVPVHRYHGGLPTAERATEMLHFTLPGRRAVMVATSGFGPHSGLAGIDAAANPAPDGLGPGFHKPDVRSLLHLCAPASLTQYASELSLLARDGEPTFAVLCFDREHLALNADLLLQRRIDPDDVIALTETLIARGAPLELDRLAASGLAPKRAHRTGALLNDQGLIEVIDGVAETITSLDELEARGAVAAQEIELLRGGDEERLDEMLAFAEGRSCRWVALVRAFIDEDFGVGDRASRDGSMMDPEGSCGRCDVCRPATTRPVSRVERTTASASASGQVVEGLVRRRKAAVTVFSATPTTEAQDSVETRSHSRRADAPRRAPRSQTG